MFYSKAWRKEGRIKFSQVCIIIQRKGGGQRENCVYIEFYLKHWVSQGQNVDIRLYLFFPFFLFFFFLFFNQNLWLLREISRLAFSLLLLRPFRQEMCPGETKDTRVETVKKETPVKKNKRGQKREYRGERKKKNEGGFSKQEKLRGSLRCLHALARVYTHVHIF